MNLKFLDLSSMLYVRYYTLYPIFIINTDDKVRAC